MSVARHSSDKALEIGSGCEVSSPIITSFTRVREQVIILCRPADIQLGNGVNVLTRSGVLEEILVAIVLIHVINQIV